MPTPSDDRTSAAEQTVIGRTAAGYEPGALLSDKYRLESLLGEGGMGAVWRATNVHLDLPVAIKLIRADLDRGALRARLQLEARSAAKLGHPAIVRVYDVGESALGDPFIVMELLQGETLAQLIAQGRLRSTRAVQLILPIIDALAMAHGRGIVHRDLKPDNLMIAYEEQHCRPKILDFGIAKLTDPGDADHKLTEIGAVVGSPEYMSPEQARGLDEVDAGTDIWSMCVVLYEALTGCAPFTATNYNALLRCIVEEEPKPLSEYAVGDGELWQILRRGLNKDRGQRYANISQLGQALAGWLLRQGVTEDACGSSLDAKWYQRAHEPSERARTDSAPASVPVCESGPVSTGMARGPFTATIHPRASAHTWRVNTGLAAGALLGTLLLAFGISGRPAAVAAQAPAALSLPVSAPPERLPPAAHQSAPERIEVVPVGSAVEDAKIKPSPAPARISKPLPAAVRPLASAPPLAAPSAAPSIPKTTRPLDLLAPY